MKNVCFLFGINGVGKSAVGQALVARVPGAVFVQGSALLMAKLAGDRAALEAMSAEVKERVLRAALLEAFEAHGSAPLVVADMHLIVTIRCGGAVRRERMWSEAYVPYLLAARFLIAPPEVIMARRRRDVHATGRVRDMHLPHVIEDQEENLSAFRTSVIPAVPNARIVRNDGPIGDVVARIMHPAS